MAGAGQHVHARTLAIVRRAATTVAFGMGGSFLPVIYFEAALGTHGYT
jgi:hypothetical protein